MTKPSPAVDLVIAYRFIKKLSTPPKDTEAYRLGIVDDTGKKVKRPKTAQERAAHGPLDRITFNLQRIISKVPGGKSRLANYAAALWLMREEAETDGHFGFYEDSTLEEEVLDLMDWLREEAPTNAVGSGHIHGAGVGPKGEPGVHMRRRRRVVAGLPASEVPPGRLTHGHRCSMETSWSSRLAAEGVTDHDSGARRWDMSEAVATALVIYPIPSAHLTNEGDAWHSSICTTTQGSATSSTTSRSTTTSS